MTVTFNSKAPTAGSASGVTQADDRVQQAAQQQMRWNRPDTSNPWSAQTSNPDGSVSLGFTGPLQGAQQNLMSEALRNMGTATDFNQFNVGSGDDYRTQGIGQAQGQMDNWLTPLQGGIDASEKQRLLNAGYEEGSPQFQAQMAKGAGSAADLQSSLHNAAIGVGGTLGAKQQAMDLLSKQQGLAEALRQRSLPMEQLGSMQGLLTQPGHSSDGSIMSGALGDLQQRNSKYLNDRGLYEDAQAEQMANELGLGTDLFKGAASMGMSAMGDKKAASKKGRIDL